MRYRGICYGDVAVGRWRHSWRGFSRTIGFVFGVGKLEWLGYNLVKIAWWSTQSFGHNTSTWQTLRRTDSHVATAIGYIYSYTAFGRLNGNRRWFDIDRFELKTITSRSVESRFRTHPSLTCYHESLERPHHNGYYIGLRDKTRPTLNIYSCSRFVPRLPACSKLVRCQLEIYPYWHGERRVMHY